MSETPEHRCIDAEWYKHAFGEFYDVLYAHRTVEAAAPEAEFAARALSVSAQDRLLDLCCGNGRHLHHLSRHARTCVGFDFSRALLSQARKLVGGTAPLVRGDMRALPFQAQFDCLTNFFTSFGYFLSEDDNAAVALGMRKVLKRGGRFLMDHVNASKVRANLEQHTESKHGDYDITARRWLDEDRHRMNKSIVVAKNGEVIGEFQESVRLYVPGELEKLFADASLVVTGFYGDWSGAPFDDKSERMIVTGDAA